MTQPRDRSLQQALKEAGTMPYEPVKPGVEESTYLSVVSLDRDLYQLDLLEDWTHAQPEDERETNP